MRFRVVEASVFTHTLAEFLCLSVDALQELMDSVGIPGNRGQVATMIKFKDLLQTVSDENQLSLHLDTQRQV